MDILWKINIDPSTLFKTSENIWQFTIPFIYIFSNLFFFLLTIVERLWWSSDSLLHWQTYLLSMKHQKREYNNNQYALLHYVNTVTYEFMHQEKKWVKLLFWVILIILYLVDWYVSPNARKEKIILLHSHMVSIHLLRNLFSTIFLTSHLIIHLSVT